MKHIFVYNEQSNKLTSFRKRSLKHYVIHINEKKTNIKIFCKFMILHRIKTFFVQVYTFKITYK